MCSGGVTCRRVDLLSRRFALIDLLSRPINRETDYKSYGKRTMPPKRKNKQETPSASTEQETSSESIQDSAVEDTENCEVTGIELLIDKRLKEQAEELKDLFFKYNKITQDELQEIKKSQEFISNKFDVILNSFGKLEEDNKQIKSENALLKKQLQDADDKIKNLQQEQENINLYSRRECLELQGVPVTDDEDTTEIIQQLGDLLNVDIPDTDISVSHRLPSRRGQTPTIIAKFTRRSTRDNLYKARKNLKNFNSTSLGFTQNNKLFINESLTSSAKNLFWLVREFKRGFNFKYCWTKYGKVYLKKDDATSEVLSFSSSLEFDKFKSRFTDNQNTTL